MAGEGMSDRVLNIGPGVTLPISVTTAKAAILAMTGMGKTYLAKVIAEEMLNHGVQVVVGDYLGVWWGLTSSASGKQEGKNVVVFGGDHADVPMNENAGGLIADLVVNERINAVLDVSGFEDDAPKIRFMTAFARRLFHKNKRPLHFFLDEADEFVPQQPQRDQILMLAILKRIWQRGRIKGIGGTIISQRSAVVHKTLLSQSEMLIALRTVAPQDRDALAAWFKSWGTEEQIAEFEKTISNLPQYHAWFWSPRHHLFVQGKARKLETFDSSATPDVDRGLEISEPAKRTKHDIARFGKEIEKLAEQAQAEDPDLLLRLNHTYKRQLDELTEQLKTANDRLAKRPEKIKVERPGKPVKVPAISRKVLADIVKTRKRLVTIAGGLKEAAKETANVISDADMVIARFDHELARAESIGRNGFETASRAFDPVEAAMSSAATKRMAEEVDQPADPPIQNRPDYGRLVDGRLTAPAGVQATNGDGAGEGLAGGKRRILAALAQYGRMAQGRARVLAGIKSLDTWNTYFRILKRAGLVAEHDRECQITKAGLTALGDYEPLPTGAKLIDHWLGVLGPGGKNTIFSVLLKRRTHQFTAADLMQASNISSEHTFNTYIRQLKALGLAEQQGKLFSIHSDFASV
jgi:hypothetical protein